jgi:hypothetical protein
MDNSPPQDIPPTNNTPAPQFISYNTAQHSQGKNHRKILLIAAASIGVVVLLAGIATAITLSRKPAAVRSTSAKNTAASNKTTIPSAAAKQPSGSQPAKTKTNQPVAAIQQTPQQPVNSQPSLPASSSPHTVPVYTSGPFSFYYAGASQYVIAAGASATWTQAQPSVPEQTGIENHSLIEMSAQSKDGQQIVEVGWVVDKTMNGDDLPHLFVYHWVDRQTSCYNGCGFVQVSSSITPGQAITAGTTGSYSIKYSSNAWNIYYNGNLVGYYPESLWGGSFTQLGLVQVFGEVALNNNSTTHCIQMGNGLAGTNSNSARISNFSLIGSGTAAALVPYQTADSSYSYGFATSTGLNIGGPGAC